MPVDTKDVQGLLRFGYGSMKEAGYLVLRIRDVAAARAWCAVAPVATAEYQERPPEVALQVAFTWTGLGALGLEPGLLAEFPAEFQSGMAGEEGRSRRLGDIGASAPDKWEWGQPGREPHALVMLFARSGRLADWRQRVENDPFLTAFETIAFLFSGDLDGHEPFGFKDGISQPEIDWRRERATGCDELTYTNVQALGEFVLGYPNEYGKYTDRPLLDPAARGARGLLPAEDNPGKRDLGRNGTYLVLRQLEQDVRGFWQFLDKVSESNEAERLRLAEAMVGRTTEGHPLMPPNTNAIRGIDDASGGPSNRFTYDGDPKGIRCPLGSHIRRSNPRNADLPGGPGSLLSRGLRMLGLCDDSYRGDLIASTRFHRILRRGREYGPRLPVADAVREDPGDTQKRGLQFVCLNANISRQFEFVQNAWLMSTKFDGLSEESDPLMGNRTAAGDGRDSANFSLPMEGKPPRVIAGLPQFVTMRGGAYFFLPSLRALRYFGEGPV